MVAKGSLRDEKAKDAERMKNANSTILTPVPLSTMGSFTGKSCFSFRQAKSGPEQQENLSFVIGLISRPLLGTIKCCPLLRVLGETNAELLGQLICCISRLFL